MYFLLAYLSLLDAVYFNQDLMYDRKVISFPTHLTQLLLEHLLGGDEVFFLAVTAYDHYVIVCKPLHYLIITKYWACFFLLVVSWSGGLVNSMAQLLFV